MHRQALQWTFALCRLWRILRLGYNAGEVRGAFVSMRLSGCSVISDPCDLRTSGRWQYETSGDGWDLDGRQAKSVRTFLSQMKCGGALMRISEWTGRQAYTR